MPVRSGDVLRLEAAVMRALAGGYGELVNFQDRPGELRRRFRLHLEMDCEAPVARELWGTQGWSLDPKEGIVPTREPAIVVELLLRCRRCRLCLRRRARMWMARTVAEFQRWPLTVMGTVTMSPQEHFELDARCASRLADQAVDFDALSEAERLRERTREFGYELQKYFKRLRKGDGRHRHPMFRYLLVAEVHDSAETAPVMRGRPHWHMVLHEVERGTLIYGDPLAAIMDDRVSGEWEPRKVKTRGGWKSFAFATDSAFLRQKWTLGFTKFQWAESVGAAFYIGKYLTAEMAVVRASLRYGDPAGAGSELEEREFLDPNPLSLAGGFGGRPAPGQDREVLAAMSEGIAEREGSD